MAGNGRESKRQHRQYGDAEKQAALLLALRDGVPAASQVLGIPETTIYTWFERAGGLVEIRAFVEAAARVSLSLAEQAVYEEVERRAHGLSEGELMATFRKMVEARQSVQTPTPVSITMSQAQIGVADSALSAAERAYLDALRGQSSIEGDKGDT